MKQILLDNILFDDEALLQSIRTSGFYSIDDCIGHDCDCDCHWDCDCSDNDD